MRFPNRQSAATLLGVRLAHFRGRNPLEIVPGATHLFEEPGALEQVAELAAAWFESHMAHGAPRSASTVA